MKFSTLENISPGKLLALCHDQEIRNLEVDSRKTLSTDGTVFFAIAGVRHDGHQFLTELYQAGIRLFIIEKEIDPASFPEGNFFLAHSSLSCLQDVAKHHRSSFSMPVVGITGSNGKTIIKEWLYQLLSTDYQIVKNPGSYNSQLGVPLSVWSMESHHNMAIFEAGISVPGEMKRLQEIIQPNIGIFTNLGSAHNEGFRNLEEKLNEKLKLFDSSTSIIYCKDQRMVSDVVEKRHNGKQLVSWGKDPGATIRIRQGERQTLSVSGDQINAIVKIPFSDPASVENVSHCIALMIHLGCEPKTIEDRVMQLKSVPMRLELKQGINRSQIIDDTYNNDLGGLQIGLNFLSSRKKGRNTLILSDILQAGLPDSLWAGEVARLLDKSGITRFIGIGPGLFSNQEKFENLPERRFFGSTDEFLSDADCRNFHDETVLVKGARVFEFERIVRQLQRKIHGTVMEIDLNALVNNLNFFKSRLSPGVGLMVMVKAFAYGSGSEEVTHLLQYHKVNYLGVAYTDEGVELREKQIHLPIMVMNPSEDSFSALLEYKLEPEIFSLAMLRSFVAFLKGGNGVIHLKLDTGMHRLGLLEEYLGQAIEILQKNKNVEVKTVFSHLAAADDLLHDAFTRDQAGHFAAMAKRIREELKINPLLHLLNSSGIARFPDLQLDMVRLGIGLYGVNPTNEKMDELRTVATLKTFISQIKKVKPGDSVGYGRKGRVTREMTIATIAIGYADGYSRSFGNGKGAVWIHGKLAPVIGNVCMDMTMVDISEIEAREGDEVIIFGKELPIGSVAARINTIPYEILTSTHERIKRVFYTE